VFESWACLIVKRAASWSGLADGAPSAPLLSLIDEKRQKMVRKRMEPTPDRRRHARENVGKEEIGIDSSEDVLLSNPPSGPAPLFT